MNMKGNEKDANKIMGGGNTNERYQYYTNQFHYKENVFVEPLIIARETPRNFRAQFEYHCPYPFYLYYCLYLSL